MVTPANNLPRLPFRGVFLPPRERPFSVNFGAGLPRRTVVGSESAGGIMSLRTSKTHHQQHHARSVRGASLARFTSIRPSVAYRQRDPAGSSRSSSFSAPEDWHEPQGRSRIAYIAHPAGNGFIHPVTIAEVRERIAQLPEQFTRGIEVVQFSSMTHKRQLFPLYGMQWGPNVYLYPVEASLVEIHRRAPTPQQRVEARMFGGEWTPSGEQWRLTWTAASIRDFYLNNVLIHEIGHVHDQRNTNSAARERYANWFATEYGFRASRGRR